MRDSRRIPCTLMRGGTSKAVFLKPNHLPQDIAERDKMILEIFGSPDVRQIDGLGGADPLTSKLAIIARSTHPDADVDYTFGQVSLISITPATAATSRRRSDLTRSTRDW